jgi:hypothetical protein
MFSGFTTEQISDMFWNCFSDNTYWMSKEELKVFKDFWDNKRTELDIIVAKQLESLSDVMYI